MAYNRARVQLCWTFKVGAVVCGATWRHQKCKPGFILVYTDNSQKADDISCLAGADDFIRSKQLYLFSGTWLGWVDNFYETK